MTAADAPSYYIRVRTYITLFITWVRGRGDSNKPTEFQYFPDARLSGVTANLAPPLCGTPVPNTLVYLERGDQILWGIMEPPLAPPRLFCTPYSFRSSLCICACKRVSRSCYTVSVDRQVQTSYTQYDADSLRQRAAQHHLGGSCSVTESEPMSDGRA